MRPNRTDLEEAYVSRFLAYLRGTTDENVCELTEVTDKPDLALRLGEMRIGVELSQFPSSYIMRELHKSRDSLSHSESCIKGHAGIFPFEPHRWVHEVISNKGNKISSYRENVRADEVWLLLHGSSAKNDWPMSKTGSVNSREAEALLLRFGASKPANNFDRIFFIYSDGEVVALKGESVLAPKRVSLPKESGYPAVTIHHFFMNIEMPEAGQDSKTLSFDEVIFEETIVPPVDDWMAKRSPEIDRPAFRVSAIVTPTSVTATVFRDSVPTRLDPMEIIGKEGKRVYLHFVLTWSIKKATFSTSFEALSGVEEE